jgi:hypothetical protein
VERRGDYFWGQSCHRQRELAAIVGDQLHQFEYAVRKLRSKWRLHDNCDQAWLQLLEAGKGAHMLASDILRKDQPWMQD